MDPRMLRRASLPVRKKSDPGKLTANKVLKKAAKSPSLPKKQSSPDNAAVTNRGRSGSGNLLATDDGPTFYSHSTEELDNLERMEQENGTGVDVVIDDVDAPISSDGSHPTDSARTKAAIEHLQTKINKTKELIKTELSQKESNVNEYLRLAASADKQQGQRIKTVFEKRNQKSAQSISHLQKKLETYQRKLQEVETHGVSGHKQAKEVLRDMHQGLNTIVSKPKEFAHLLKNKFGSADNINQMKMEDNQEESEPRSQGGGTLPASFKYGSDDDNSSITSGSGFGAHSSPHSQSQNTSQHLPVLTQSALEPVLLDLENTKEANTHLQEMLQRITEDFESYKAASQSEISLLRTLVEEEKYKVDRLEEQINDLTELHQNEITNFKQDINSMEEKIEYRFDERTTDLSDLVDNCQTRIQRLEQQQQQQQILSMEMVENVTFRTILSKLINVVLALLAVILVLVSTAANFLSPFLVSRMRIVSTLVLVFLIFIAWQNSEYIFYVLSFFNPSFSQDDDNSVEPEGS